MLGLLWYDGSRQINLTLLIGLVALQLLLADQQGRVSCWVCSGMTAAGRST